MSEKDRYDADIHQENTDETDSGLTEDMTAREDTGQAEAPQTAEEAGSPEQKMDSSDEKVEEDTGTDQEDGHPEESTQEDSEKDSEEDLGEDPEEDLEEDLEEDDSSGPDDEETESKIPAAKRSRRKRRGRRRSRMIKQKRKSEKKGKKGWIIAGSITGAVLLMYLGAAAFFYSHFLINTTINGKDFSGKTVEDVKEYLIGQVAGYQLTLVEQNNVTDVITGADISLVYKENSDIEDALRGQNQLLWIVSLFSRSSTDITIEVEYDEAALEKKIQTVQAVTAEQKEPVSARPEYDGNVFVVAPEEYGTAVDMETFTAKIKEYITEFRPQLDMMDEGCYILPKYTSESPEVQEACDTMNQYLSASITYPMTEDVVVDKELISSWLSYDEEMKVTFDETAVREWMRGFGSTYDTVGTTRSITSPTGETTEVSGGTYGWSVDEDTETQKLIDSIKNGEVAEREPVYNQTAASHSEQDWGTTYIEVDISEQHMWYIVDGAVALESDVVTGLPKDDRDTPTGVYSILYKEKDSTLKGETDPDTGKPSYETPVDFWMPFTWQGHGFHDATWQPSFGGSRYQTNGSHGCVNMPHDKASQLFDMIEDGTPVIVHD